jgi:hypothetical protein
MNTVSVLGAVNKANKPVSDDTAATCQRRGGIQPGEYVVKSDRRTRIAHSMARILADCSPEFQRRIGQYLEASGPADRAMLDAWLRVGHEDRRREKAMPLVGPGCNAMTPLGVACLKCYVDGWIDEDEAIRSATPKISPPEQTGAPTKHSPEESPEQAPAKRRECKPDSEPDLRPAQTTETESRCSPKATKSTDRGNTRSRTKRPRPGKPH